AVADGAAGLAATGGRRLRPDQGRCRPAELATAGDALWRVLGGAATLGHGDRYRSLYWLQRLCDGVLCREQHRDRRARPGLEEPDRDLASYRAVLRGGAGWR